MILYFADRKMNILGQASTKLPHGLTITEDNKIEDIETGVAVFQCKIHFDAETRDKVNAYTEVGNYLLRSLDQDNEFYTITETETDTKEQTVYLYAEDAGMDLLNEVFGAYEADKAYPISHYINKYAAGSGFQIGINEAESLTRKLKWDGEATATERIASVAAQFDGCEVSYSFTISGLAVTKKYINIYRERGKDLGIQLRLNEDIDRIVTTKSITNMATALQCTGGTPENAKAPITLKGHKYDDGDFYVDGTQLKSRSAFDRWSRYLSKDLETQKPEVGGHIVRPYSYDTLSQATLCANAVTELKKMREMEVNYEVDITKLPDNIKIGDRVNIIDDAGELYLSTRILALERSECDQTQKATLGEYLIRDSGISARVEELSKQFAENSASAARALEIANNAKTSATEAQVRATSAIEDAAKAQETASNAKSSADHAMESAETANMAAANAQNAVHTVEESVSSLENAVSAAQDAADYAKQAAEIAETKAVEAKTAAGNAATKADAAAGAADDAKSTAVESKSNAAKAQSAAQTAQITAHSARTTARAAKLDAVQAIQDIGNLSNTLETVSNTMHANYARKTELTETEAQLQSQIDRNAAQITSTVSMLRTVDETANDAAEQAEAAQAAADEASAKADQASASAVAAQAAADTATMAATAAQAEADTAAKAALTAQTVADDAEQGLVEAKAELAAVLSGNNATEAEIQAAQEAVSAAQGIVYTAQTVATSAAETAADALEGAIAAVRNADQAQAAADNANLEAGIASALSDKAAGSAASEASKAANAQTKADQAKAVAQQATSAAATAQETANTAKTNAESAKATADTAVQTAENAQKLANHAVRTAEQAQADLEKAQIRYEEVMADVDATEEELESAIADVAAAQAAADQAEAAATAAQNEANAAKANAEAAQTAADDAKTAAALAQAVAADARKAADAAQKEVDGLAVRVTKAETGITQNAESILLSATKEEVTETLGGYYTKTEADAAIQVSADGITSSVSKTYSTKQEIKDLKIGGRNMFKGYGEEEIELESYIHTTPNGSFTQFYNLAFDPKDYVGDTFTISFYAKSPNGSAILQVYNTNGNPRYFYFHSAEHAALSTDWKYYSFSFTNQDRGLTCSISQSNKIEIYSPNTTGVLVKKIKIELGDKATAWTPAPEDIDQSINDAKTTADDAASGLITVKSSIDQFAESISMLVTGENGESLMTQTEDGWTFNMTGMSNQLDEATKNVNDLNDNVNTLNDELGIARGDITNLGEYRKYISFNPVNSQPCIELGEGNSDFKVQITNTEIRFMDGSTVPASINNKALNIGKAVIEEELKQGGFTWIARSNGNLGLLWKG